MSGKTEFNEQIPKDIEEQLSQEIAAILQHRRSNHSLKKEMTQLFRARQSTMQLLIPKKNILIISVLALISWLFVPSLISLFFI